MQQDIKCDGKFVWFIMQNDIKQKKKLISKLINTCLGRKTVIRIRKKLFSEH